MGKAKPLLKSFNSEDREKQKTKSIQKDIKPFKKGSNSFLIAFIILLALLSFTAFFRNTTWKHDLILWDDVISKGLISQEPTTIVGLPIPYHEI